PLFSLSSAAAPRHLHSFPTRRSSDLRNPDVFELARAKSARLLGDLLALLATLKGIPAGYSKDLQEDKALLFDACDTLAVVLNSKDRKSTRLNSSHVSISYAVFCLKKK